MNARLNLLLFVSLAGAFISAPAVQAQNFDGLRLWLRADHGITADSTDRVTQWEDRSGDGHHAIQQDETMAPLLVENAVNGRPALRFDGVDDYLEVPHSDRLIMEGDISSWFVIKVDDFATFRAVWGKTFGNLPAPTDYYLLPETGIPRVFRGDGTLSNLGNVDGIRSVRAETYMVAGFEMSGTTLTHYLDGQENGSGEITAALEDYWTSLMIGTRDDFVTRFKGELAELLIYNRALNDTERGELNGYLKARYGLENDPPMVGISSPAPEALFDAPAHFTVVVNATDVDGSVSTVDLLANGGLVVRAIAPPYSFPVSISTPGTVTFTALATDDKGATAESEPVTVTVSGAETPELQARDHLQLWLRADAGVTRTAEGAVLEWEDQSGQGHHAIAADESMGPLWVENARHELPALRFDGADDYLEVASAPGLEITGDIASFFVVRFDDLATFRAVWGKTEANLPRSTDYYLLPGSGLPRLYRGSPEGIAEVTGTRGVPQDQFVILGFNMAGSSITHFLNGHPNGAGQLNAPLADAGTPLRIGTRDDFGTRMKGDIAEVLIYDEALSETELESVTMYLAARYGIPMVSSANQPPAVNLTAPDEGEVQAPATLSLSATASDPDGAVVEVAFFANGQLLGATAVAPFQQGIRIATPGTVVLTAVARDNLGGVSTSPSVTLSVAGMITPELEVREGLQLWLKADEGVTATGGGAVLNWEDQSGQGNNAAQPEEFYAPVLMPDVVNSGPALRFDGESHFLTVPTSPSIEIAGDLTSFFLVRFEDFAGFRAVWAKTFGNQPRPTDYYLLPGSGVPRFFRGGEGGNASVDASGPVPANAFVVLGFSQSGSTLTHYMNGRPFGSGEINVLAEDFSAPLSIGTRDDFGTWMKGDIAELLIYDRALATVEIHELSVYLGSKHGVLIFEPVAVSIESPLLAAARDGNQVILSWQGAPGEFQLESAFQLPAAQWTVTSLAPEVRDGLNTVTIPLTDPAQFFRLRKQ
jgi:hypothetical protein